MDPTQIMWSNRRLKTTGSQITKGRTLADHSTTNPHRNRRGDDMNNILPRKNRLQCTGTSGKQAAHKAPNTTVHQRNPCRHNDPTINRPNASRPGPNQPGMQGLKRELRPASWQHHAAPRPTTTILRDTTEHRVPSITLPTNKHQQTTQNSHVSGESATSTESEVVSGRHRMRVP